VGWNKQGVILTNEQENKHKNQKTKRLLLLHYYNQGTVYTEIPVYTQISEIFYSGYSLKK
jgi:hypothetical protein